MNDSPMNSATTDSPFPNILWALHRANNSSIQTWSELQESPQARNILTDIELGMTHLYSAEHTARQMITELDTLLATKDQLIAALRSNQALATPAVITPRPKRLTTDPPIFTGKGSAADRQRDYETWELKMQGVFLRDHDFFAEESNRILYIGDRLAERAYEYIQDGLATVTANPSDPTLWEWATATETLAFLRKQYKILDSTQAAKNTLDHFPQGEKNYWNWKADLDAHMRKAKKTPEQKVDLLRKFVSDEMADLVTCMPTESSDPDYTVWSAQMDIFAKNLANRSHNTKIKKKSSTSHLLRQPSTSQAAPTVLAPTMGEPMDLDRITDSERQHRMANHLCLACGQPGHRKDAHDPRLTANPLPMPPRLNQGGRGRPTSPWDPTRGRARGRGHYNTPGRNHYNTLGRNGETPYPHTSYNQQSPHYLRVQDPGFVIEEDTTPSSYTPTESDDASVTNTAPPQLRLKGHPLD